MGDTLYGNDNAMITYQIERYEDVIDELWPLLESNFVEAVRHKDKFELNPDRVTYVTAENSGYFKLYTARDGEKLIGYAAYFIQPSQHYATYVAVNDVLYVTDEYRNKDVARSLLSYAEADLKEDDVSLISFCLKRQSDLPTSLGYVLEEYKYTKYIGDNNG
jgi:GNAT superfamily N-acetyltransferase